MSVDVPLPLVNVAGACPHDCPDTCAWTIGVQDGRAVTLAGAPDHPFTSGGLCAKVNRFLDDRVYHPDRVLHPMRRSGPKGSGSYVAVSWEDALDEIASRTSKVVSNHGADAVLRFSYLGTQGLVQGTAVSDPFFARLGATELVRAVCGNTGVAGASVTMGDGPGLLPEELEHSRFVILWGTNTLSTNLHLWPFIRSARERGAKVVVIDPQETRTAKAADWHVRPLPGTDAALALGMMRVLVDDDLVDHEYVAAHTVGFEQLRERLAEYPTDRVSELTGLDEAEVIRLARAYGSSGPAAIRLLVGMEHHEFGAETFRTIACLPALVGAWKSRGGGLCHMTFQLFDELDWSCGVGVAATPSRSVNMVQLGQALTGLEPPIRALFVYNANPAVIAPEQNLVLRGLARDDLFTVVLEHFMTDTAQFADFVLPATTQIEHVDVMWSWGQTYLAWNDPAIPPVGEALSNAEIFRRLGRHLGFEDPAFTSDDLALAEAAIKPLGDKRIAELRERGWIRMDDARHVLPYAEGGFRTASGKAEFFSREREKAGLDPLPSYRPAWEGPHGDSDRRMRYPLQLITAKGAHRFLNSGYVHVDRTVRAEGEQMVDVNDQDAESRGIKEGSAVRVYNDRGSLSLPARVGDRVRPGVVSIPSGWWASVTPAGRSANALTSDGVSDLGQGGDFHDTMVQVQLDR
ncbi:MAG: molybdopterin-dependent oxidoreductase [Actinomycetes bacterium]